MTTDSTKAAMIFEICAHIEEFERALEEQFKPALRKAIADVMAEFLAGDVPGISLGEVLE